MRTNNQSTFLSFFFPHNTYLIKFHNPEFKYYSTLVSIISYFDGNIRFISPKFIAPSAGAVEYTDCFSTEG